MSAIIAVKCHWKALDQSTIGSDHYPIISTVGVEVQRDMVFEQQRWKFEKADWEKFYLICKTKLMGVNMEDDIEEYSGRLSSILIRAAEESIPKAKGNRRDKVVP